MGGLAELGSGGRKEDLVYAATPATPSFCCVISYLICKISKIELMAPSIMRKESVVEGDEVRGKRGGSEEEVKGK